MELKGKIEEDLKSAMLGNDKGGVIALRGLKAAILDAEVASGKRTEGLSDMDIEKLIAKEVKKRREAVEIYEANGRGELAENEKSEIKIFEKYLPKQMSEQEVAEKIDEVLMSLGGGEVANMGSVIGKVKMLVGSSADGAMIAKLVKEKLG